MRGVSLLFPATVLLALAVLLILWFFYGWGLRSIDFVDAKSFWLGARLSVFEGLLPYGLEFQSASEVTPGGYAHPFVYPPPSLLLLAPLGAMDYGSATLALLVTSHLALLMLVAGIAQVTLGVASLNEPKSLALIVLIAALVGLSWASRVSLGHGQVNYFVLCGIVWFWAACIGRAWRWAGAFGLVVAGLLKPYFGIFALFLLLPVGGAMLVPVIVISLTFLVVSFAILPSGIWAAWAANALGQLVDGDLYLGQYEIYSTNNHSLRSAVDSLIVHFAGEGATTAWREIHLIPISALLAVQLASMWKLRRAGLAQTVPAMALLPLVFLVSPVSWPHYGLYSAVAAGVLAAYAYAVCATFLGLFAVGCLLLLLQPTALAYAAGLPGHSVMAIVSVMLWLVAMVWTFLTHSSKREPA